MIDGITAGTAAASKAVVLDGSKNIATLGTIGSGAITATGSSSFATSIKTPLIEYTDGDDAITIADGGGITAANGITSTAASNSFGATSFNDANITNVGDISLDSISSDAGTAINVTLGTDAGDDFIIDGTTLVVEGDNNRVGIGTAAPANILDISQSGNEVEIRLASNSNDTRGFIYANNNNQIGFKDSDGDSVYQTGDNESHIWSSQGSEKMRLTAGGNLGIGEASPDGIFHVKATSGHAQMYLEAAAHDQIAILNLKGSGEAITDGGYPVTISSITSWNATDTFANIDVIATAVNTSDMIFATQTAGTKAERMRITGAGNVGIGTSSPETIFTIDQKADDNGIRIYGYDDVSANYGEIFIDSSGYLNIDAGGDRGLELKGHGIDFWVSSGGTHIGKWTHDGKLGVGTTSPSNDFVVSNGGANGMEFGVGASSSTIDVFNRSTSSYTPLGISTTGVTISPQGTSATGLLIDQDNNKTALKIDSESTTLNCLTVEADALTTGSAGYFYSDSDSTGTRNLLEVQNDNDSASGTTALKIKQDAPALGMKIDQNGDASAILIESASTSANVLNLSSMETTTGTIITLNACDDLTSGKALYIDSNHDDNTGRYLVWIQNNHVNANETRCFYTQQDANGINSEFRSANGSFTDSTVYIPVERSANSGFNFLRTFTTGDSDSQHALRGDGQTLADGAYSSGGADYAEYFESKDGKAMTVGVTVKLDGDKVVACEDGDTPIGVVRPYGNSIVIGNSEPLKWTSKYLKDDYGAYIKEEYTLTEWIEYTDEIRTEAKNGKDAVYEHNDFCYHTDRVPSDVTVPSDAVVISKDGNGNKLMRNKLNPNYDESKTYKPREERDEWCLIGLLGQIPITKGQPMASNWIKMKDISDTVEMWMVK